MPDKLPYPASQKHLAAFVQRIRRSPRQAISPDWLVSNIDVSNRSNATATLGWLAGAGLVDADGVLTDRGTALISESDPARRSAAAVDAISALIGEDRVESLRAGTLTKEALRDHLMDQAKLGEDALRKFLGGLRALVAFCDDSDLKSALGANSAGTDKTSAAPVARNRTASKEKQKRPTNKPRGEGASNPNHEAKTTTVGVLASGVLSVVIDSGWAIEDIRATLRMLQMIERGEALEEVDVGRDGN